MKQEIYLNKKPTLAIYGIRDINRLDYPDKVHDHNLCLMQGGKILQYLQLERYTRRKYDNRLENFLEGLIEDGLLKLPDEFDLVSVNSFAGNCFTTQNGKIKFEARKSENLCEGLENANASYRFNVKKEKKILAYNCSQELAHIATCLPFYGNFKENSLLIHFDGGSSVSNFSAFIYKNGTIKLLEFNWNLKYLTKFYNGNALNFMIVGAKTGEHNSVPGKLMGYACFGSYNERIENWLVSNNYFKDYWNNEMGVLTSIKKEFGREYQAIDNKESLFQDIVATFQSIFEREILKKIQSIQKRVNAANLYYSGGCALNIITNTRITEECGFEEIFIPPCCNDSGLSIGAAAFLEWKKGNSISIHSPYLNNVGLRNTSSSYNDETIAKTAELLLEQKIIGVCNGYGETGPRALGNRSIIALPNSKKLAEKVSIDCKRREWYRPVAPVMLKKVAELVTGKTIPSLAKYMLMDFFILPEYREKLSGVIHNSGTARIQIITSKPENPFLYDLLTYLYEKFNILGLINTSFNRQGEPIVHTEEDALKSAKQMGLDAVIINNTLVNNEG